MSLPSIVVPTFPVKLFSQKKSIDCRPYLVKEEKIMLMAQAGNDVAEIERAVKQIISNCTFGTVDITTLPSFDMEYLFLKLRAKSVNNVVNVKFRCQNPVDKPSANGGHTDHQMPCGTVIPVEINLDNVELTVHEGHTNKIWLSNELGVVLNYPTAEMLSKNLDVTAAFPLVLDSVFNSKGEVFEAKDSTPDEIGMFVDALTVGQVDKIREFFTTMPVLEHTFAFTCSKCGYKDTITLRGLSDFFD